MQKRGTYKDVRKAGGGIRGKGVFERLVIFTTFLLTLSMASMPAYAGSGLIQKIKVVPGNHISPGQGFGVYVEGKGLCDDMALFVVSPQSQQKEWKWYNMPPFNGKSAYDLSNPQKLSSAGMGNIPGNQGLYTIIARPGPKARACKGRAVATLTIKEASTSTPDTTGRIKTQGTISIKLPDLVVQSITLKQKPNGQCVPYITIKNIGSGGVPLSKYSDSWVTLIKPKSSQSSPSPYYWAGDYNLSAVDPNHHLTQPHSMVSFEWKSVWLKKGTYAFGAVVDRTQKINEINEGNNTKPPQKLICGPRLHLSKSQMIQPGVYSGPNGVSFKLLKSIPHGTNLASPASKGIWVQLGSPSSGKAEKGIIVQRNWNTSGKNEKGIILQNVPPDGTYIGPNGVKIVIQHGVVGPNTVNHPAR